MNDQQKSVTLAFVLVLAGLAVKHSWFKKVGAWSSAPPSGASPAGIGDFTLTDWSASIILYVALMLVSDTQLAPVAPPIAWAVGLINAGAAAKVLSDASGQRTQPTGSQGAQGSPSAQGNRGTNPPPPFGSGGV